MGHQKDILSELRGQLPRGKKFLVAVSGGKDSVVLLHACCQLKDELGIVLEVAHVDHSIRATSERDANFVKSLAARYGLPFHTIKAQCLPQNDNLEAWGRRLRYGFFADVLSERQLDFVITAHTASDVAETLLMRLIANKEPFSIEKQDLRRRCLRPLLAIPRRSIEDYLAAYNLDFREDETNQDVSYLRNRVRHHLISLLREEFNERIEEILAERALFIHDDLELLRNFVNDSVEQVAHYERFSRKWLRAVKVEMKKIHPQLRWRFAEALLMPVLGFALGRKHGQRAAQFLSGEVQGVELPSGVVLKAKNGGVSVIQCRL